MSTVTVRSGTLEQMLAEKRDVELAEFVADAARAALVAELIDWCETNVANYGERSRIQRHLRELQRK